MATSEMTQLIKRYGMLSYEIKIARDARLPQTVKRLIECRNTVTARMDEIDKEVEK